MNIRLRKMKWVIRVMRMKDKRVPKKALKVYRKRKRPAGRPRGRW